MVFDGEITGSPATSPPLYLPSGQTHLLGRLVVFQIGLLVKQQYQPKALHDLDQYGSAADCVQGHLHEIVGESTRNGAWSWHSGVLSVPGFFWEFTSFYKKSAETATLFVKRTTKALMADEPMSDDPPTQHFDAQPPRADGVTGAERYLKTLCDKTFLTFPTDLRLRESRFFAQAARKAPSRAESP